MDISSGDQHSAHYTPSSGNPSRKQRLFEAAKMCDSGTPAKSCRGPGEDLIQSHCTEETSEAPRGEVAEPKIDW